MINPSIVDMVVLSRSEFKISHLKSVAFGYRVTELELGIIILSPNKYMYPT